MIKIGVDFDDVLAGFVNIACELCNKERGTTYTKEDITAWGYDTCPAAKTYRHITMMTEYMRCSRYRLTQRCSCECSDRKPMCIS